MLCSTNCFERGAQMLGALPEAPRENGRALSDKDGLVFEAPQRLSALAFELAVGFGASGPLGGAEHVEGVLGHGWVWALARAEQPSLVMRQ